MSSGVARPRSHLESPFIESLRRKYPKACNRSLTNLSVLGLSLPEDSKENRSVLPQSKDLGLSNWSKGLSSSQPDLLKASDFTFFPLNGGIDIDAPPTQTSNLGTRTKSISGLHLIQQNENDGGGSGLLRRGLSSSLIHERLEESRRKMNEIASRITVISRSNSDLSGVGLPPPSLSLPRRSQANMNPDEDDEVDDSAPISLQLQTNPSNRAAPCLCASELTTHGKSSSSRKKVTPPSLSTGEAKLKLEEIRAKLTRKCESLQKRREELFKRIQPAPSLSENVTLDDRISTSVVMDPTSAGTNSAGDSLHVIISPARLSSVSSGSNTYTPKRSGTDSDGDSGIDLSMKRSKLGMKNCLAPKLRKYNNAVLIENLSVLHSTFVPEPDALSSGVQSVDSNYATYQSNDRELAVSESSKAAPTTQTKVDQSAGEACAPILPESRQAELTECNEDIEEKKPSPTKSVRFSQSTDVIDTQTERLEELKQLAEQAAYSSSSEKSSLLPDTALEGFDSDSELSTSDTDSSLADLTDVDPRIAQLALGARNPPKKADSLSTSQLDTRITKTSQSDLNKLKTGLSHANEPNTSQSNVHEPSVGQSEVGELNGNKLGRELTTPSKNAQSSSKPIMDTPSDSGVLDGFQTSDRESLDISLLSPSSITNSAPNSAKRNSPPKPPRTHIATHVNETPPLSTSERDSGDELLSSAESVQPYSIIDASAFKGSPVNASSNLKTKRKTKGKTRSSGKPPLPKSTPPKNSSNPKSGVQSDCEHPISDSPYEDINLSDHSSHQREPQSRRSRLDRLDFEPPYSYSGARPKVAEGKSDSDWESTMTDDDRLTIDSTSTARSASKGKPDIRSQISKPQMESPARDPKARGRTASCSDLWGSNVSLYSSNEQLSSTSSLSGSRSSLSERVGSFRHAAKKKMKSLKRSLSLDRLGSKSSSSDLGLPPPAPLVKKSAEKVGRKGSSVSASGSGGVPVIKKSLSWRALDKLKFTKKGGGSPAGSATNDAAKPSPRKAPSPKNAGSSLVTATVESPNHFRAIGKLLELCSDGCQRIQLNKPPHGPYGFYIGPSSHKSGFFVTRLSDSYAEKLFSGLLTVGDEIKEINSIKVSKLNHNNVLDIIAKSNKLVLKIRPNSTVTAEEWF